MPTNVELPKTTMAQAFFPITRFHYFHRHTNINYQLNRFLIPGLEDVFAEIGRQIKNFKDWKQFFLANASSFEVEGKTDFAMQLYRAAESFIPFGDPDKAIAYEKFVSLFYDGKEDRNFERIVVPYGLSARFQANTCQAA